VSLSKLTVDSIYETLKQPIVQTGGTTTTFDQARADFGAAWRVFLSNRTEGDFQAWRNERDWKVEKYRAL
jgi:hypothetical protein